MGKDLFPWAKARICGGISPKNRYAGSDPPGLVSALRHRAFSPPAKALPAMQEKIRRKYYGKIISCDSQPLPLLYPGS